MFLISAIGFIITSLGSFWSMFASIFLMIISFTAVAITKLGIEISLFESEPIVEQITSTENPPQDRDFKMSYVVNAPMVNIRQLPSSEGIIMMVLKEGEHVEVLEIREGWSYIAAHQKTGWVFSKLIAARIE